MQLYIRTKSKVTEVPTGARTHPTPRNLADGAPARVGLRCVICDFSRTHRRSTFNPEIADYGKATLSYDPLTGDPICSVCERGTKPFRIYESQWRAIRDLSSNDRKEINRQRYLSKKNRFYKRSADQEIERIQDLSWARFDLAKRGPHRKKLEMEPDWIPSSVFNYEDALIAAIDRAASVGIDNKFGDSTKYYDRDETVIGEEPHYISEDGEIETGDNEYSLTSSRFQHHTLGNPPDERVNELALYQEAFVGSHNVPRNIIKDGDDTFKRAAIKFQPLWNVAEQSRRSMESSEKQRRLKILGMKRGGMR